MKLNIANKLTILRIILVPVFMFFILVPVISYFWARCFAAAVFALAAITDFLGGKLARTMNMVTDFGKFLDPLADKFLIFGALLAICASPDYSYMIIPNVIASTVVIFRELAVTSLRLVASSSNDRVVIAASKLGKLKTCSQILFVLVAILEPIIVDTESLVYQCHLFAYLTLILMTAMTVWSGYDYIKKYWDYLRPKD